MSAAAGSLNHVDYAQSNERIESIACDAPPERLDVFEIEEGDRRVVVVRYASNRVSVFDERVGLSAGEREVAGLALAGLSNSEIAGVRGTSTRTVANQIAKVFRKSGVSSRGELASRLSGVADGARP